jgi:chemotaxis protein methyltransferase CheR
MNLNDTTFKKFRDFVYDLTGIYFIDSKKYLLETKLYKRINANKLSSFEDYYDFLTTKKSKSEIEELFNSVTINETYFFRGNHKSDIIEQILIPEVIKNKKSADNTIKIWSAACSSGEEPYTIALIIYEKFKTKYPNIKFEIIGSDISNEVIEKAKNGVYSKYSVKNIPNDILNRYFKQVGDDYELNSRIKDLVEFKNVNLFDSTGVRRLQKFDLIFCENVLIYFDEKSKRGVLENIHSRMNQWSLLSVGNSETLIDYEDLFEQVRFNRNSAYLRR